MSIATTQRKFKRTAGKFDQLREDREYFIPELREAVEREDVLRVQRLLKFGARRVVRRLSFPADIFFTAVLARKSRSCSILKLLLNAGASPDNTSSGWSCLHAGRPSALHVAVVWGVFASVQLLVRAGADLEARDGRGKTPIWNLLYRRYRNHLASPCCKEVKKILALFLNAGANINATRPSRKSRRERVAGKTMLHIAAMRNNVVLARELVAAGIDVMAKSAKGKTALEYSQDADISAMLSKAMEWRSGLRRRWLAVCVGAVV